MNATSFALKKGLIATGSLCLLLTGTGVVAQKLVAQKKEGDAAKGKDQFEQCAVCHNVDSDEKKIGPALKGLFKKDKLKNGKKPTEANVRAIINAGGNGMPSYAEMLSDEERNDLIAYLKTL